jgi:hypothetical protein
MKLVPHRTSSPGSPIRRWVEELEDEDLSFIKRFVLASGSLKDFERLLRVQHAEGKIDRETLKVLLNAYDAEAAERDQSGGPR